MATAEWFGKGAEGLFAANATNRPIDWVNNVIKVSLHSSLYVPNQDTHQWYSDLTNELANGNGYTTGGYTLVNKTFAYNSGAKEVRLDADDAQWMNATFSFRISIVYKWTGTGSTSPLIGYTDWVTDQSITGGTYTLVWDAEGIMNAGV